VTREENIIPFLQHGRLLHIKAGKEDWGWGILAGISKQRISAKQKDLFKDKKMLADLSSGTE
jgi:rRNA-processing arch domain